jgi:transcriptional regulator with XRE-family HTH domain
MNGDKLMKLRILKGLSQRELADALQTSHTLVNIIESGKNANPKIQTVITYCDFFDITVFDFMGVQKSKSMFLKMLKEWVLEGIIDEDAAARIYKHTFTSSH